MVRKKVTTISMTVLRPDAAGIDIGARSSHVALPPDRNEPVREFGTFTQDLHQLADWLVEHGITTVAMESTGVYWVSLFQILEARGIEVFLVNAHHAKAVPGRKTDVKDCQWLQYLHSVGLLRASFRPPQQVAAIRTLVRSRSNLVRSMTRCTQLMQKSLTLMNLQLHHVISDISGVSGLAIIDAILDGERNPQKLARLSDYRIKTPRDVIVKSLEGDYLSEHVFTLRQAREGLTFYKQQIEICDDEIQRRIEEFNCHTAPPEESERKNTQKKLRLRDARDYSIHAEMKKAFGIDLFELPGFSTESVLAVFTEVGTDFTKFRSAEAFASWLSLCPNNEVTGGKVFRAKTRRTKSRLAAAFRQAAYSLANAKTHYGDLYRRLRAKLGGPKAVTAIANRLARLLFHLITTGQEFDESQFAEADIRYKTRQLASMRRKAQQLGFTLVPTA